MSAARIVLFYDDGQKIRIPVSAPWTSDEAREFATRLRDLAARRRPVPFMSYGEESALVIQTAGLRLAILTNDGDEPDA